MPGGSPLHVLRARRRPRARGFAAACAAALIGLAALLGAGCGGGDAADAAPTITVFAAASLFDVFTQLGDDYEAAHPGTAVAFNFASSRELAAQIEQGASADVLATADTETMATVARTVVRPQLFAGNELVIAVAPGNPEGIRGLADLADPALKVVLAAPEAPAGRYARHVLGKAGVTVRPVSLEETVKGVVTKVSLGEADAGIVYATDVAAAEDAVDGVAIPAAANVAAAYPIAVMRTSERRGAAQAFVEFVLSDEGQRVLRSHRFLAPPAK